MIETEIEDPDYDKILEMQDFFPKIFLQPSQIKLDKTNGLRVIKRFLNQPDKFEEEEVKPILIDEKQINKFTVNPQMDEYGRIEHPAGHGLLSLFKRTKERRIKLAICICVYSEAKHMLKTTIKGIQQSNKDFLQKAGIMSHQIIVIVIFDGIQSLNSSKDQTENMISFFNEIDIKNGFRQRSNSMALDQFLKQIQQNKIDINTLTEEKMGQVNVFTEEELNTIQSSLFENQYKQYIKTKKLLQDISKIKNQKQIKLDLLPFDVVKKYQELCVNFCAENHYWFETQEEIQQYLSNSRKNLKFTLIYQALCEVQDLCQKYLESRQDKVILYPVRMEKDYLKNPRETQNAEDEFSSFIQQEDKRQYNYLFLCVKHKNAGKLNSHLLFFQGFCRLFDPEYCMLTDVGVKPIGDSIFKMYQHMELTPKCGGVCGYMSLKIQNPSDELGYRQDGYNQDEVDCMTRTCNYFISIQRAQQFEYHYAHMLDKPFESFFNYIHVLPGAFSGYRWKALKSVRFKDHQKGNDNDQLQLQSERYTNKTYSSEEQQTETLLNRYLKTAVTDNANLSLEDSNMYLAQDRILCLGIHALGYDLHYLPDVESSVDPVTSLTKLLGQRRRWINGSWFAFNYVRQHSYQSQSLFFLFQLLYYSFVQKLQWIGPSLFYATMYLTLISFVTNNVVPEIQSFLKIKQDQNFQLSNYNILWIFNIKQILMSLPDIINFAYILAVFSVVLWSTMTNHNNQRFKVIYYGASTLIGIYGLFVLGLLVYNTYSIILQTTENGVGDQQQFFIPLIYLRALILFVIGGYALPIIWTLSFKKTVEMVTSLLSYIYFSPTYINILQIFAFCRIDDLSWGTKGLEQSMQQTNNTRRQWERRKFIFILQYVSTNVVLSYLLVQLSRYDLTKNIIILTSSALVVFLLAFKLIFALIYLIKYNLRRCCKHLNSNFINQNRANGYRIYNALKLIEGKIKEIEKERTKKKKYAQFKTLASATSIILSKTLSNFGKKIRNKVAKHILHNNMIPRKDFLDPFKKRLKAKKKLLNKKLTDANDNNNFKNTINTIEQVEEKSQSQEQKLISVQKVKQQSQENQGKNDKREIKKILQSIRQRYKSKIKPAITQQK